MHGPEDSTNLRESETRDPEPGVGASSVAGVGGPEGLEGLRIGPYKLVRFLDKGGMGAVYEARRTDRPALRHKRYALKLIRDGLADDEAGVLQHLDHPNIVGVHDAGTEFDDLGVSRHFIVMELVRDALSITEYCRKAECSIGAIVELIIIACKAIESSRGIRHLDLKPSNILIDRYDSLSVCDFGLARLATDSSVGQSGGTPSYMAPEQLVKPIADIDERADEFGLAAVLYELIIGARPHLVLASSTVAEISREKAIAPPAIHEKLPEADAALNEIVQRGLSFEPDDRFGTVREFRLALESWLGANQTVAGRCARWLRGHTASRVALLVVVSALVAAIVSGYVVSPMLWRSLAWESRVEVGAAADVLPGTAFEHVVMLAIPSGEEVEALAAEYGIEGVEAGVPSSWRAVHAVLCEKLGGDAGAVVFDFFFQSEVDADDGFAASIRECMSSGTPVVVATRSIRTTDEGVPDVSERIWNAGVHWGHAVLTGHSSIDTIPILIDDEMRTIPSVSLAAVAAVSVREGYPSFAFDPDYKIEAGFWAPSGSSRAGTRRPLPHKMRIIPSAVHPLEAIDETFRLNMQSRGVRSVDMIAWLKLGLPSPETCVASTVTLEDVLSNPVVLSSLRDRVVLVFDTAREPWIETPAGSVQPPSLHAAAIEMMLSGRPLRILSLAEHIGPMVLFGCVGAGFALIRGRADRAVGDALGRHPVLVSVGMWIVLLFVVVVALFALQHGAGLLVTHAGVLANALPSGAALVVAVPIVLLLGAVSRRVLRL